MSLIRGRRGDVAPFFPDTLKIRMAGQYPAAVLRLAAESASPSGPNGDKHVSIANASAIPVDRNAINAKVPRERAAVLARLKTLS